MPANKRNAAPDPDSLAAQKLDTKSLARACRQLASQDQMLAEILEEHGIPPLWNRPPGLATLVHIILEQQVSLKSAAAINGRIKRRCEGRVSAPKLIDIGESGLRELGVTRQKSHYIFLLAEAVFDRRLQLKSLLRKTPAETRTILMEQKGIGVWTTEVYLLMALCYQDSFPAGDLALIRELNQQLGSEMDWDEATEYAQRWQPYRAAAARILWLSYLARLDSK
ncbi:MAG: DNA-3-methyladenine glycosylase 2 family protein [Planctomycetota bacterium]